MKVKANHSEKIFKIHLNKLNTERLHSCQIRKREQEWAIAFQNIWAEENYVLKKGFNIVRTYNRWDHKPGSPKDQIHNQGAFECLIESLHMWRIIR